MQYSRSFDKLCLGVYATDQNAPNYRAVAQTLRGFGIPFRTAQHFDDLRSLPAIVATGPLPEYALDRRELTAMYTYAEKGGRIFFAGEVGKSLFDLIGVTSITPQQNRFSILTIQPVRDSVLRYVDEPEEFVWRLGNPQLFDTILWSFGAVANKATPLALFDDSSSAMTVNSFGAGKIFYLGVGLDNAILGPQLGKDHEAQRAWINTFEPTTDMFMLLLHGFYESFINPGFYYSTTPGATKTAVLLSHDLDAQTSFEHAFCFAAMEQRLGVRSTFFVCTKNFTDETDTAYFTGTNRTRIDSLFSMGFSIGSHSVSHSKQFASFPLGTSIGHVDDYQPLKMKTLLGELQASKMMLQQVGVPVTMFRAGEMASHRDLGKALIMSGYSVSSNMSANDVMCDFPFYLFEQASVDSRETPVLEIPVTCDESMGFLTRENKDTVVERWLSVIGKNKGNNAITTLLMHPTNCDYKLDAFEKLIVRARAPDIWIGDLMAYADFYRQRTNIQVLDAGFSHLTFFIHLSTPYEKIPPEFSMVVTGFPKVKKVIVRDKRGVVLTFDRTLDHDRWIIYALAKDQQYYVFQQRLVLTVLFLFVLVIVGTSIFFMVQRMYLVANAKKLRPKEHEAQALEIVYAPVALEEKVLSLQKLGQLNHTRSLLLEYLDFLKGEEASAIIALYHKLGFFEHDRIKIQRGKWHERAQAAIALGKIKATDVIDLLVPLLKHKKREVALAAAEALSRFEDTRVLPILIEAIKYSTMATAQTIVAYLMPMRAQAATALRQVIAEKSWGPELILRAIEILGNLRDQHSVEFLMQLLKEASGTCSISSLSWEGLAPYLLGKKSVYLPPATIRLYRTIACALGKIGDDSILEYLETRCIHPVLEIRTAAIEAIGMIGNQQSINALHNALRVTTPAIAQKIIDTIARLGDRGGECLMGLIEDPRDFIRLLAIQKLEEYGFIKTLFDLFVHGSIEKQRESEKLLRLIIKTGQIKHIVDLARAENVVIKI